MIGFISAFFTRGEPAVSEATSRDAATIATLHAASFRRGWSEQEVETLLLDRAVVAHRVTIANKVGGFIMSRKAADEAEILSVAVNPRQRGRGLRRTRGVSRSRRKQHAGATAL
jgi:ribosomal-protein-alanine N-acetyltransferase